MSQSLIRRNNMELKRVDISIQNLKSKKTVAMEEVLQFFIDLCKDIKDDSGRPVSMLPISDKDIFASSLEACGMLLTMIGNNNPELLESRENDTLNQKIKELEEQTEKIAEAKKEKPLLLPEQINYYLKWNENLKATIQNLEKEEEKNNQDLEKLIIQHLKV